MDRDSEGLRILYLYPDQMNIYADRGNIIFLRRRCELRGIDFTLGSSGPGERFDPDDWNFIYIGGGQDRDQEEVAADMIRTKRDPLAAAHSAGSVILAVCGGYQLLGKYWETPTARHPGLELVDAVTVRSGSERLIGPAAIETGDGALRVAGFENHGGRTWLGPDETPFGRVLAGRGNNGEDGTEGIRSGNLIGTYLHGPLLPKNAILADRLVELALYGESANRLEPIGQGIESLAHEAAMAAALNGR